MSSNPSQGIAPLTAIREFLKLESASGILLVVAGALAMVAANTVLFDWYEALLATQFKIQLGEFKLDKPLVVWINDLLMAIFFLLVGLEIKREVVMGELSDRAKVALPAIAAAGGMVVVEPFDTPVCRLSVVLDPEGNSVILHRVAG
jgi:NhaA family Na+:H+ antiporter